MTNHTEEHTDPADDPAAARLAADLEALYSAPAPALRFDPSAESPVLHGSRRWRWWQPAVAGAVASAGLVAVLVAPSLWQTESRVNAETVFARASTVAETSAPAAGPAAYHLVATTMTPGQPASVTRTETWYAGADHIRSEQDYDATNPGPDFGTLVRGDEAWLYGSFDRVYRAVRGPASELGVGFVGGVPGSGTATDLSQVLAQYTGGCQVPHTEGEDSVAGRAAYRIVVSMDFNACPVPDVKADPGKMGPLTLWVDKESFLPLKTEQLDATGATMYVYEVTQIEVGAPIPDSAFTYQPPAGVTVQDVANLTEAKFILSGYTKDGVPAQ